MSGILLVLVVLSTACTAPTGDHESAPRPNIFLLNIDMLRADHLGVHGYERDTTPVLDALGRNGILFERAHAHAPWTFPSVASLLTGLLPTSHGASYAQDDGEYVTQAISDELETVAEILRDAGYTTAAFVTNPLLKSYSGLSQGFELYRDDFVSVARRRGLPWAKDEMRAENVHREVLSWLDESPRGPLFVYLHYIDLHGPYLEPKPFDPDREIPSRARAEGARLSGRHPELARDLYDGELRHLDREIGRFLEELESRGLLQDSVVIVTSDHGEEFGDHGGHGHGHTLYEEQLHVPLIVARTRAVPFQRRIETPVGHIDILPTLAELAGVEAASELPGESLLPAIEGASLPRRAILSEMDNRGRPAWNAKPGDPVVSYALLDSDLRKYVFASDGPYDADAPADAVREQRFDLKRDPGEARPLLEESPPGEAKLAGVLARALSLRHDSRPVTIDGETRDRLAALGYISSDEDEEDAESDRDARSSSHAYRRIGESELLLDVHLPGNPERPAPVLLFFHGGGWVRGSRRDALPGEKTPQAFQEGRRWTSMQPYLDRGVAVVSADYRLAAQAFAPAAVEDVGAALRWIGERGPDLGLDPTRVVAIGVSAGGHLALMLAFDPPDGAPALRGVIDLFGPTDVVDLVSGPHRRRWARRWIGRGPGRESRARDVSPLLRISSNPPPVLIVHSEADETVPFAQAQRLERALSERGADVELLALPEAVHGFLTPEEDALVVGTVARFLSDVGFPLRGTQE